VRVCGATVELVLGLVVLWLVVLWLLTWEASPPWALVPALAFAALLGGVVCAVCDAPQPLARTTSARGIIMRGIWDIIDVSYSRTAVVAAAVCVLTVSLTCTFTFL